MIRFRLAWAFIIVLFVSAYCAPAQLLVYDNSAQYSGYRAQTTNEYGDELMLQGTARVVTKLQFEYLADFFANFDEKVKVRLYANTGAYYLGNKDYQLPGVIPLWESPFIIVNSGAHTLDVPVPSVKVPDKFTWTVQFYGISQRTGVTTLDPFVTNDVAGLMFYGAASIGSSFNDFWERLLSGWTPVISAGPPKNNFAVAVTAVPEVLIPRLAMSRYGSTKYVVARWPAALTNYTLQFRSLSSGWNNISAPPAKIGDNWERVLDPNSSGSFYRLKYNPPVEVEAPVTVIEESNIVRVRWPAEASGKVLQSETSPGSGNWQDRATPAIPNGDHFEAVLRRRSPSETFRLRDTSVAARVESLRAGTNLVIRWPLAARGQALQAKLEGGSWLTVTDALITETESHFETVIPMTSAGQIFRLRR